MAFVSMIIQYLLMFLLLKTTKIRYNINMIKIEKLTDDVVKLIYKSKNESFLNPDNIGNFKPREGFSIEDTLIVPINQIIELYLALSFIKEDHRLTRPSKDLLLKDINSKAKQIRVFISKNKPNTLQIKYVNYKENIAGIIFLEINSSKFRLFVEHLDRVIDEFDILRCVLSDLGIIYCRKEQTLYITDKHFNMQDSIRIDSHGIYHIKSLYNTPPTHDFCLEIYVDQDKNVSISNNTLIINGKRYHQSIFHELGLLLYRY